METLAAALRVITDGMTPLTGARGAAYLHEFLVFGFKQLAACAFAGSFLFLLLISGYIPLFGFARYDFLFAGAILIQLVLIGLRLETWREVAVLSLFHAIGMGLELFKTAPGVGSWSYPEAAFFRLGTVPLYSGFMYAAVASYMMQAWRIMDLRIENFPRLWIAVGLSLLIYGNFFANHYVTDMRWVLALLVLAAFRRTRVTFTVTDERRWMPMVVAFGLIGFFIWVAENIATFFGAWVYPHQEKAWAIVGPNKISSWVLLVIISFIIVASLKQVFPKKVP